jgi:hypothetical protein
MKKISLVTGITFLFILLVFSWSFAQMEMGKSCSQGMKMMGEQKMMFPEKCGMHQEGVMSKMGCCKKGMDMGMGRKMHGMMGEKEEMGCCKMEFFLCCKDKLGLTDKQIESLKSIKMDFMKTKIKMEADLQIAHLELKALMVDDKASLKDIEAKLRALEKMKTDMKITHLKAFRDAKTRLTQEQKDKIMKCDKMKSEE